MENEKARDARVELRAWYLGGLRPKLARASSRRVVDSRAVEAFEAELRALLDLAQETEEAA